MTVRLRVVTPRPRGSSRATGSQLDPDEDDGDSRTWAR